MTEGTVLHLFTIERVDTASADVVLIDTDSERWSEIRTERMQAKLTGKILNFVGHVTCTTLIQVLAILKTFPRRFFVRAVSPPPSRLTLRV